MAKYKCSHQNVANKTKCTKPAEGFVKVGGKKYLMCKRHGNSEGYSFIPFTEAEAIEAGLKKKPVNQGKPTSIFGSNPKDGKRKK